MSVGVIVEFNFKPGGAEIIKSLMKDRLPSTRNWDGCEHIYLGQDSNDPNHLVIVERWTTKEQYGKYREWAMAQEGTEELMSYLVGEMTTLYVDDTGA